MKTFAVLLFALAYASALDVDWSRVTCRGVDQSILELLPSERPAGRIIGGEEAVPNSIPYQAGLFLEREGGTAFCGGSLIDLEWVLTTARCVDGVSEVTVVLGGHNIRDSSEAGRVESVVQKTNIIMHENYVPFVFRNDIALIKIPAVELTNKIQTINLPRTSQSATSFEDCDSVTSGWGKSSYAQSTINDLLRYINNIYIDGKNGRSICNSDFGGPLTVVENDGSRTLVGAASFRMPIGCKIGLPAAFTRVTSYLDWIAEKSGIVLRP